MIHKYVSTVLTYLYIIVPRWLDVVVFVSRNDLLHYGATPLPESMEIIVKLATVNELQVFNHFK